MVARVRDGFCLRDDLRRRLCVHGPQGEEKILRRSRVSSIDSGRDDEICDQEKEERRGGPGPIVLKVAPASAPCAAPFMAREKKKKGKARAAGAFTFVADRGTPFENEHFARGAAKKGEEGVDEIAFNRAAKPTSNVKKKASTTFLPLSESLGGRGMRIARSEFLGRYWASGTGRGEKRGNWPHYTASPRDRRRDWPVFACRANKIRKARAPGAAPGCGGRIAPSKVRGHVSEKMKSGGEGKIRRLTLPRSEN